jgi:tetratricopeptide (TPR) repeat protein
MRPVLTTLLMAGLALLAAPADSQSSPTQSTAPPAAKGQVQAKTQAEYDAYQAIKNKPQSAEEFQKAVDDFSSRFPDSNLRVPLYRALMKSYQQVDDPDKMMASGLKVLAIDKDDPEALIVVAEIQEEHTGPMDLDREQRMDQSVGNAQHALQTIDSDLAAPAGTPADRLEAYKRYLRSTALAIVGTIQYKRAQYAEAEITLKKAIDVDASNPDSVVVLRLALALDQQRKYPEALQQASRAVDLTKDDTEVGKAARSERDRLLAETGGNNSQQTAPSANAPDATAPNSGAASTPAGSSPGTPDAVAPNSSTPNH